MATRIYLPSSGTPAISNATNATWTETTGFDRLSASTSRGSTAMTNKTQARTASAANNTWLDRQYIVGPLAGQTYAASTIKGTIRALESAINDNVDAMRLSVRVVAPDGTTFRGTIYGPTNGTVAEFNTTLRAKRLATGGATTQVVVTEGDYLVIEIGATATTGGTSISTSINYGDNSATDLGDNETDTAANNPFIELAGNMKFLQRGFGQAQAKISPGRGYGYGQALAFLPPTTFGQANAVIKRNTFVVVDDNFNRVVATGLGTSTDAGNWTTIGTEKGSVDGSRANIVAAGTGGHDLNDVLISGSREINVTFQVSSLPVSQETFIIKSGLSTDQTSQAGNGVGVFGRIRNDGFSVQVRINNNIIFTSTTVSPLANTDFTIKAHIISSSNNEVKAKGKIWKSSDTEPGWDTISTASSDNSFLPGHVGLLSLLGTATLSIDSLNIIPASDSVSGQAQAQISKVAQGFGQAQAQLKGFPKQSAQAQTRIASVYERLVKSLGPSSYWKMDEQTGATVIKDYVGAIDGTVEGTPTFGVTADTGLQDTTAITNGRFNFGDNYDFAGTVPYTIVIWAKHTGSFTTTEVIASKGPNSATSWIVYLDALGDVIHARNGTGNQTPPMTADTWSMIVAQYNTSTGKGIHLDDKKGNLSGLSTLVDNANDFKIGSFSDNTNPFIGTLDEIALFSVALSYDDIQALYTVGKSGAIARPGQAQALIRKSAGYGQAAVLINGSNTTILDTFTRTVSDGAGTADVGGDYTSEQGDATDFDVDGSALNILVDASQQRVQRLSDVLVGIKGNKGIEVRYDISVSALPITGSTLFHVAAGRSIPDIFITNQNSFFNSLDTRINFTTSQIQLSLTVESITNSSIAIAYTAGDVYTVIAQFIPTANGRIFTRRKFWKIGTTEPGFVTEVDFANINGPHVGHVALGTSPAAITGSPTIFLDNLQIQDAWITRSGQAQATIIISGATSAIGQAQADIKAVSFGLGQSQTDIKQTYTQSAQAQADIKATGYGSGQAQTAIKGNAFAQAQTDIRITVSQCAQANADIKSVQNSFAQSQADVKTRGYGSAQSQSDIKATSNGFGQANSDIKAIGRGFGQAQTDIQVTQSGVGQTTADIKSIQNSYGQAQADIKAISYGEGQAQTDIKTTLYGSGQANTDIKKTSNGSGQANTDIEVTQSGFAQATTDIKSIQNSFGQAQSDIKVITSQTAQAQSDIQHTYTQSAQAQADIKATQSGFGQAQTTIVGHAFGQCQASILITSNGFGQSQASIKGIVYNSGQANASILGATQNYGQALADIATAGDAVAQSQANIKTTYVGSGQAQTGILHTYIGTGQAQATILGNAFGQAQTDIQVITNQSSQAQADIKVTFNQSAQSQSAIQVTTNVFGQANASIKSTLQGCAQAQTDIVVITSVSSQAQADIKSIYQQYAQAQTDIRNMYIGTGQTQASIKVINTGWGQANASLKSITNAYGQAQTDIEVSTIAVGQAQTSILSGRIGCGQSQADIKAVQYDSGQSQASIKSVTNQFGQSQTDVKQTTTSCAQAQASVAHIYFGIGQCIALIKAGSNSCGQAQVDIVAIQNGVSQAQSDIKAIQINSGQSQTYIKIIHNDIGQAQADILTRNTRYAQAQSDIQVLESRCANAQALIRTTVINIAQAQSDIKARLSSVAQAQAQVVSGSFGIGFVQALIQLTGINANGQAQAQIIKSAGYGQAAAIIFQTHTLKSLVINDRETLSLSINDRRGMTLSLNDREYGSLTITDRPITLDIADRQTINIELNDREF